MRIEANWKNIYNQMWYLNYKYAQNSKKYEKVLAIYSIIWYYLQVPTDMCLIATSLEGDKNYIWHWLLLYRDSMVETTTFLIWIEMYWIKSFLLRQSITGEKLVYFFVISLDRNTVECYHKLPQQNKFEIDCRKLIITN